jgi:hypothetical protein
VLSLRNLPCDAAKILTRTVELQRWWRRRRGKSYHFKSNILNLECKTLKYEATEERRASYFK